MPQDYVIRTHYCVANASISSADLNVFYYGTVVYTSAGELLRLFCSDDLKKDRASAHNYVSGMSRSVQEDDSVEGCILLLTTPPKERNRLIMEGKASAPDRDCSWYEKRADALSDTHWHKLDEEHQRSYLFTTYASTIRNAEIRNAFVEEVRAIWRSNEATDRSSIRG